MCSLRTKIIWDNPWHFTLPTPIQVIFYICSLFQPLASTTTLATCRIKLHFSSSTTNLFDLYNKPLLYNGKRKIAINFHTKHIGINDWIYTNFKHIGSNMRDDNKTLGISKQWHLVTPLQHLLEIRTWGIKWKRTIDKTDEWAAWWWTNVKVDKENLALLKQSINISKEDMENYH